jgi:hypothetical protein
VLRPDGRLSLHVGSHHMCDVSVGYPAAVDEAPYGRLCGTATTSAYCLPIVRPGYLQLMLPFSVVCVPALCSMWNQNTVFFLHTNCMHVQNRSSN